MGPREQAVLALQTLVAGAYPWKAPPSRRLKLWSDVSPVERPACFLFEGGLENYQAGAGANGKRTLDVRLFIYVDAHDPRTTGASLINAVLDALDGAFVPAGPDGPLGRVTLGGRVYSCAIVGRPLKDPGDLDGDGLVVVPIQIILP